MKKFNLTAKLQFIAIPPKCLDLNIGATLKPNDVSGSQSGNLFTVNFWADDYPDACRIAIKDLFPVNIVSGIDIIHLIEDVEVQPKSILQIEDGKHSLAYQN